MDEPCSQISLTSGRESEKESGKESGKDASIDEARKNAAAIISLLPCDLVLSAKNGRFTLVSAENEPLFSASPVNFSVKNCETIDINAETAVHLFTNPEISGSANLAGTFSQDLAGANADLTLSGFSSERFALSQTSVSLKVDQDTLRAALGGVKGLTVNALYNIEDGKVSAEAVFDNFDLENHLLVTKTGESASRHWTEAESAVKAFASGTSAITGTVKAGARLAKEGLTDLSYETDLRGEAVVPELPAPLAEKCGFTLAASGTLGGLEIKNAGISWAKAGEINLSGKTDFAKQTHSGNLVFENFRFSKNSSGLSADAAFNGTRWKTYINSSDIRCGDAAFDAFTLIASHSRGIFGKIEFLSQFFTDDTDLSALTAAGFFEPGRSLDCTLNIDNFRASTFLHAASPFAKISLSPSLASQAENVRVTSEIALNTDFHQLSYNTSNLEVRYSSDLSKVSAFASLSGSSSMMEIDDFKVVLGENTEVPVNIRASLGFLPSKTVDFTGQIAVYDMNYDLEGRLTGNSFDIHGPYGLEIAGNRGKSGELTGYLRATTLEIPLKGQTVTVNVNVPEVRLEPTGELRAEVERFEVVNLATPTSRSAATRVSALVTRTADGSLFADVNNLVLQDERGALSGGARLDWDRLGSSLNLTARLASQDALAASPESLVITGQWRGPTGGVFNIESRALQIERFSRSLGTGRFTGTASLITGPPQPAGSGNPFSQWRAVLHINSFAGRVMKQDYSLSGQAALDADSLRLGPVSLSAGNMRAEIPQFLVNRLDGTVAGEVDLTSLTPAGQQAATGPAIMARLVLDARSKTSPAAQAAAPEGEQYQTTAAFVAAPPAGAKPVSRAPASPEEEENSVFGAIASQISAYLALFNEISGAISVDIDGITKNLGTSAARSASKFDVKFAKSGKNFNLSGGPGNMARIEISEGGVFYAGLSNPSPVRGTAVGILKDGQIDVRTEDLYIDLQSLWQYLPKQDICNATGGFVTATLRIHGALSDPMFTGLALGGNVRLSVPRFLGTEIGPLPLRVVLDGNEMGFGPVEAPCGTGRAVVTGNFRFERWIPSNFTLKIDAAESAPVPFAVNISPIMAKGGASGTLSLIMEDNSFTVKGRLTGEDAEITMSRGKQEEDGEDGNLPTYIDMTLTSGRRVECIFPDSNLPVLRATAAAGTVLAFKSDSETGKFSLTGNVDFRGGEIFYFKRSFYIKQGSVIFDENETRPFSPMITARAETRDTLGNEHVTISMAIDNKPLLDFTPTFESTPALSQVEILALLGDDISGETSDGGSVMDLLNSAGDALAQFQGYRRLERALRKTLHLDMFSVRTQVLQNLFLLNLPVSRQTSENVAGADVASNDGQVSWGDYLNNTTVQGGIYVGPLFFVQGMLALRYDESSGVNTSGLKIGGGLYLEPELAFDLQTPLFDLRFDLDFESPETLFLSDSRITLSRHWSLQ